MKAYIVQDGRCHKSHYAHYFERTSTNEFNMPPNGLRTFCGQTFFTKMTEENPTCNGLIIGEVGDDLGPCSCARCRAIR